ncbi:hypothetical protein [Pelagibius sp.]|uniref:hypothetical protein n=1 Tax=Pelagibius sp. TaxID=1931238 RepID=UPI00262E4FAD|nr:hypothetical protein [Pelagibius sp.]
MLVHTMTRSLLVSATALMLGSGFAAADSGLPSGSLIGDAATQLAARSDVFQATTASLDVVPAQMAGSCPMAYALNVRLGARSPGTLSYKIVTNDGRESQIFRAQANVTEDGRFAAQASHQVALSESTQADAGASVAVFDPPAEPRETRDPDFFERLFGTGPTAEQDDPHGLRNLAFRVQVVAPNEVASVFDSHTVSCEEQTDPRIIRATDDDQRDDGGRDRGRDDSSDRGGGRDRGGVDASGGTID